MQSISVNAASNALSLFGCGSRRYFGASFAGARSHFDIVLRDSLVTRAVSRSELAPYVQSRRLLVRETTDWPMEKGVH